LDRAWTLVAYQPGGQMRFQIASRQSLFRLDDGMYAAAKIVVRNPDDAARYHERMLIDRCFDFRGIDVCTANENHVRAPVREIEIALAVHPADIPDGFPATRQRAGFRAEVPIGRRQPRFLPHEYLADLATGQHRAICGEGLDLGIRCRLANRAPV